jgi:hypothetical protein
MHETPSPIVAMRAAAVAVICGLCVESLAAHHSITAVYDTSRSQTIEGQVSEFHFINPHPFLVLAVRSGGQIEEWKLEMDNRFELAQIGVTRETFKPGDHIVVVGSVARKQPRSLYIRKLDRPSDGFSYEQVGASPRVRSTGR